MQPGVEDQLPETRCGARTVKTTFRRGNRMEMKEHINKWESKSEELALYKHSVECHKGEVFEGRS